MSSRRGLTSEQIKARGYKAWPGVRERFADGRKSSRRTLAGKLYQEFGSDLFRVPGFGAQVKTGREPIPWCSGFDGVFLPERTPRGEIVGAQIKTDKGAPKYATLSKGKACVGAKADMPLHFSRPTGYGTTDQNAGHEHKLVFLTEGILKADIASDLLGYPVIGSGGQTFDVPRLEAYLHAGFGADVQNLEVVIALDEDTKESAKRNSDRAKEKLLNELHSLGFQAKVATWSPTQGKGLDDFLLVGHTFADMSFRNIKPRTKRTRKLTAAELELLPELVEERDDRPSVTIDEQRRELVEKVGHVLANPSEYRDKVLLLQHLPGVGKSTSIRRAVDEATAKDGDLRVAYFVPTHGVEHSEKWARAVHVYGRAAKAPEGTPCAYSAKFQELKVAGVPSKSICQACPSVSLCSSSARGLSGKPYYLAQFRERPKTVFPGEHFLAPSAVKKTRPTVLVLDDIDLDAKVQLPDLIVTESDLAENIATARAEPNPEELELALPMFLRPGLNLLSILADFRRYLLEEEAKTKQGCPRGSDLVWELWRWCERESRDLLGAVEAAHQAEQPDLLGGTNLEEATPGPKAIIGELADVLGFELVKLQAGEDSWSSRFYAGNAGAGTLSFRVKRRINLGEVVHSYDGKPIILADASATKEKAQRWFPGREVVLVNPKAELPPEARIWQHVDRRYGMRDLADESTQAKAFDEIEKLLNKHESGKVGVITHAFFESRLRERFAGESRLEFLHFFGQRSRNDCKDVRTFIIFGTPHPNEEKLIEQTEALYFDGERLNDEVRPYRALIEDLSGTIYATHHRGFLDERLQEQLEARTREEMLQALYRCRPFNLDAPEQGDLLDGYQAARPEVDIYVFSTIPLGLPVRVVSANQPVRPREAENVLGATRELSRGRSNPPSYANIHEAVTTLERPVSYRQVLHAIAWIEESHGKQWREDILMRENPPRTEELVNRDDEDVDGGIWSMADIVTQGMRLEAEFWMERAPPRPSDNLAHHDSS